MQSLPDFVRLAEAYGHVAADNRPMSFESKLSEALEHVRNNRLVFVDVTVDGSEQRSSTQTAGRDGQHRYKTERSDDAPDFIGIVSENESGALSRYRTFATRILKARTVAPDRRSGRCRA